MECVSVCVWGWRWGWRVNKVPVPGSTASNTAISPNILLLLYSHLVCGEEVTQMTQNIN